MFFIAITGTTILSQHCNLKCFLVHAVGTWHLSKTQAASMLLLKVWNAFMSHDVLHSSHLTIQCSTFGVWWLFGCFINTNFWLPLNDAQPSNCFTSNFKFTEMNILSKMFQKRLMWTPKLIVYMCGRFHLTLDPSYLRWWAMAWAHLAHVGTLEGFSTLEVSNTAWAFATLKVYDVQASQSASDTGSPQLFNVFNVFIKVPHFWNAAHK